MKLKRLRIANCSRIADVNVEVRDNMVLIGPNGSGKTTVLLCLDMLLGMDDRQLRATLSRGFIRDESRPMTVEVEFANLNEREQAQFANETAVSNGNALVARLDVSSNGNDIDVVRGFSGLGSRKSSPQAQVAPAQTPSDVSQARSNVFGWTLLKTWPGSHVGAGILAIDEPEAHLHPSSQRSLAKTLKAADGQKILVTHSPTIAGSFEPDEIVVIRADGTAVQPKEGFLSGDAGMLARWWIGRQLEPLTAGAVIAVEGPSDRVIVDKVASALDFDLDRHDVVVIETNGCGDMKVVESIFGSGGFGLPLFELIDEDARATVARRLNANPAHLEAHDVFVSVADLEDEYVRAIGARRLWDRMRASNTFTKNVFSLCETQPDGCPTEADLAGFIREKSNRKIPSALVAAQLIDETNALAVSSVAKLLQAVSS